MPLTPKGEKILKSMEEQYGPEKGEQVLYASKNAGTITGIDAMPRPHPFGQTDPCRDAEGGIGNDPGLPRPEFEHPQLHPGGSTPPEPALGDAIFDVNGGITGGAVQQRWGEGSPWPNVGDALPTTVSIADIQGQADTLAGQWLPRELGPDQK